MLFSPLTATTDVFNALKEPIVEVWTGDGADECDQPVSTIAWPNVDFRRPPNDFWLEPFFRFGTTFTGSLGGRGSGTNLCLGLLFFTIYGPKLVGIKTAYELASKIKYKFSKMPYGGVYTRVEEGPVDISTDSEARWSVTIAFEYWEQV